LGVNRSHLRLVCNFGGFSCLKSQSFDQNIFEFYWFETITNRQKIMLERFRLVFKLASFSGFCARVMKFWAEAFLTLVDVKQSEIDPRKDVGRFGCKAKSF